MGIKGAVRDRSGDPVEARIQVKVISNKGSHPISHAITTCKYLYMCNCCMVSWSPGSINYLNVMTIFACKYA